MITDQKRTIRKAQGYDLGFEYKGVEYWINTNKWNEEKEERFYKETGLKAFRESKCDKNLVFYDPAYFEIKENRYGIHYLHYKNNQQEDIPQPINMSSAYRMFAFYKYHTSLDLNSWDMSQVKNMAEMFCNCQEITNLDLSNWDVSNVRDVTMMFHSCSNLKILNLSDWDLSKMENMMLIFSDCDSITSLDLSNWRIPKANIVLWTFAGCKNLHKKYNTTDNDKLLKKIIKDSNKVTLKKLELKKRSE